MSPSWSFREAGSPSRETRGTNVHLAYPDQPYQVEVYSPRVGEALRLVGNGTVKPYS